MAQGSGTKAIGRGALTVLLSVSALPASAQDASMLFDLLCGRTLHFYDPGVPTGAGIGNQIEYTAPDGSAFLWHPDDAEVIVGSWEVLPQENGTAQVCYEYPPDSFANSLIPYDGGPICWDGGGLTNDIVPLGVRNGDPYGLSDGVPPFEISDHPALDSQILREQFPQEAPATGCEVMTS